MLPEGSGKRVTQGRVRSRRAALRPAHPFVWAQRRVCPEPAAQPGRKLERARRRRPLALGGHRRTRRL
ncbi:hypothetical protein ACRRTK_022313 [Alexandromys fortis]